MAVSGTPNILSIAGSDPSGGAGIQADLKSISANGGYAMAVITALTAQSTKGVSGVLMIEPDFVTAQIAAILDDIRVDAIKIGMLGSAEIIEAVADALKPCDAPMVLDTVMVAKGGDRLLRADAVEAMRNILLPRATMITPNLPEAADLLGTAEAKDQGEMEQQARALLTMGPQQVLLKGGHLADETSPDLYLTKDQTVWLPSRRIDTKNTHGTGCTLSSALATHLALTGDGLKAAKAAKAFIFEAIAAADALSVGHGHGPTDHFFALRT